MTVPLVRELPTWTTSCAEPEAQAFSAPRLQVTTPPVTVPPPVADTNVVLAGSVSLSTTPEALALPVFAYDSVYVRFEPGATGSGASVIEIVRTGAEETVVLTEDRKTGGEGERAVLGGGRIITKTLGRGLPTRTTSCTEPEAPAFKAPGLHVTMPPPRVPPPVADTKVVLAGSASVSTTPLAFELPELEYASV